MNSALLWEMIKLNVREQSIRYAATKKAKILKREKELEKAINRLQIIIDTERHDTEMENGIAKQEIFKELERKKSRIRKKIIEYRTKGAILRSKCEWYNEGEKKFKIFPKREQKML